MRPGDIQAIEDLNREVIACARCPRLVAHRQEVARKKRRMYLNEDYWGRPLPGYGDPEAQVLIMGLAPAAHGGNRTGRMFTGDRSGDWLFETLYKSGFASSPISVRRDDGLTLRRAYITAAVRCAPPGNKPLPQERINCLPYLLRELALLRNVSIIVALGKIAFDGYLSARQQMGLEVPKPRPSFGHGATSLLPDGKTLVASYHPSQQNTQTGRLTREMFEGVFSRVRHLVDTST
jgi:uracil-DNA glycosylase family 4